MNQSHSPSQSKYAHLAVGVLATLYCAGQDARGGVAYGRARKLETGFGFTGLTEPGSVGRVTFACSSYASGDRISIGR